MHQREAQLEAGKQMSASFEDEAFKSSNLRRDHVMF
jgi:hypothetical protein